MMNIENIKYFSKVWNMIDVCQKRVIPVRRVKFLLRLLKGRLEVDPNKDRLLFKHMCREMERLNNGDDVSFHDILKCVLYFIIDTFVSVGLGILIYLLKLLIYTYI
jgi:hypothetical protein